MSPAEPSAPSRRLAPPEVTPWLRHEATIAARLSILGLAALFAIWLVMQVETVALATFLAFAQTALLWPVDRWLRRYMHATAAALICVVAYVAAFGSMAWFIIQEMMKSWPGLVDAAVGGVRSANAWALDKGLQIPPGMVSTIESQIQERVGQIASGVGTVAVTTLSAAGMVGTVLGLSVILTIFGLASGDKLWESIKNAIPAHNRRRADDAFRSSFKTARWWMWASTITGLVDGIFIGLGLAILGIPLAIPIGALTSVLGYIPMLGATMAGVVAVVVALFFGGLQAAIWALVIVIAVQQLEGNILSPLLLSRAMQFNPIITLLLASVGGLAFGIVGLFLAVPTAGIITAAVKGWRATDRPDQPADSQPETDHDELNGRDERAASQATPS